MIIGLLSRPTTASRQTLAFGAAAAAAEVEEGPIRPSSRCARFGPLCSTFSSSRSRMHSRTVRSFVAVMVMAVVMMVVVCCARAWPGEVR